MEIIAFSYGNSEKISTWSNVPYLFLCHAEAAGHTVHRVDLKLEESFYPLDLCIRALNHVIRRLCGTVYELQRTPLYSILVNRKMKKALRKWKDSDLALSFDFDHVIPGHDGKIKSCLFCDWTIRYEIEEHRKRAPTRFEAKSIERQDKSIMSADYVVTFFPNVYDEMRERYGERVHYIGNFINSVKTREALAVSDDERFASDRILFIGAKKYRSALEELIKAVKMYNEKHEKAYAIDVIGMNETDVTGGGFCNFYSYLDKNVPSQMERYYSLIASANVMVNTADGWVGASSLIEAMYYGTPVIINPNEDIIKTFGNVPSFGRYCYRNDAEMILECLEDVRNMSKDEYVSACRASETAVEDFTWEKYIEKFFSLIEK